MRSCRSEVSRGSLTTVTAPGSGSLVLEGVEPDLVPVRVVQLGQDPADAGPVHPGVLLAQRGQPGGELVDRVLVRHADAEVVEAGGSPGALGIQPQAQGRASVGMRQRDAHQAALLDELQLNLVAQAAEIPLAGPVQIGNRQLQVVNPGQDGCVRHAHDLSSAG